MKAFAQTEKQTEIMNLVLDAAQAGSFISVVDLREKLSYGSSVTVQAIQFSLRYLEQHGMIERIYPKGRLFLKPTILGWQIFRPSR